MDIVSVFSMRKKKMTPILAEFLGTLLLIGVISFVGTPLAIGASLALGVFLLGPYSGGHFNPAVTLWAFLSNKVSPSRAMMHVAAQCLAAVTVFALKAAQ
jgi:aquaporin Z